MKKIYQTPKVSKVIYLTDIMESAITPDSTGVKGSVTGQTDTDWEFGGTMPTQPGSGMITNDAKGNGRSFWDDGE